MMAALIVSQALPELAVAIEPSWPTAYRCRAITDNVQVVEFSLRLRGQEMTFDRDVLAVSGHKPIRYEKSGAGLKSDGENYARFLVSSDWPHGTIWITQTGKTTDPATQLFIDLSRKGQLPAERKRQASGYCAVAESESSK